jgi:hypothetical protein
MAAQEEDYFDVFQSFGYAAKSTTPKLDWNAGCGANWSSYKLAEAPGNNYDEKTCNDKCLA